MLFSKLSEYFTEIEGTSKRLAKTATLQKIIEECEPSEVAYAVYMALGELRPPYDRLEFNLADKMVIRALAIAGKVTVEQTTQIYKEKGDLGVVAYQLILRQAQDKVNEPANKPISLSVSEVYQQLCVIAQENGVGSQERKINLLAKLLKSVGKNEAKYVVRMVLSKLRLGFADKTILDALSYHLASDKSVREQLENFYQQAPDVGELTRIVKESGVEGAAEKIGIRIGRPIMPALASRLPTADEMIKKMGKVFVEPKFDGTRVQIHFTRVGFEKKVEKKNELSLFVEEKPNFEVKTFTRNLDENSAQFPELVRIGEQIKANEVILDSEAVGYDPKTHKMLPFQMTITRKRKHGIEDASASVPLRFFVFDVLALDGKSLLQLPLYKRREILKETIKTINKDDVIVIDESIITDNAEELRSYHKKQLEAGLEGAVIKQYEGKYVPGRLGFNWVKFKEEEGREGKLTDTLDVVVMGYYRGKGKRTGFGIGAFLVGIKNNSEFRIQNSETGNEILTIAKIGTGLTDEQFKNLKENLHKWETESKPEEYQVDKLLTPDVWVNPAVVVEVAADELTISPTHTSGYALRFPRLVKFREDKSVGQITTMHELKQIGVL